MRRFAPRLLGRASNALLAQQVEVECAGWAECGTRLGQLAGGSPAGVLGRKTFVRSFAEQSLLADVQKLSAGVPYNQITLGVAKEMAPGERRISITPSGVATLLKAGFAKVLVEKGAGTSAHYLDAAYAAAGATLVERGAVLGGADVLLGIRPPSVEDAAQLKEGAMLVSYLQPARNKALLDALVARRATALGMDCIPRTISRAQMFDTLSSMANIAGYRAVTEAAHHFPRFFTGQITAAGRVPPAKVLVVGGGVAGLAAVGCAKSMGAIVRVFDTRGAVREQAKSLGAEFLTVDLQEEGESGTGYSKEMSKAFIDAEMKLFGEQCADVDIIITTALIPGKGAPLLFSKAMIDTMRPGSVVVDLSAEAGGNCEYTKAGEVVVTPGRVSVIGYTDLPSRMAGQASTLYNNNLTKFLSSMGPFTNPKDKATLRLDDRDPVVRGALVLRGGELTWPPPLA